MHKYIRFNIENLEPLRIADIYFSQSTQIDSLRYIPGSTIRGAVINKLSKKLNNFEQYKKVILENIRFLNAYPMINNIDLFPSAKGFYEDKNADGNIVSIFKNDDISGKKRAKLGEFCFIENNCIKYMSSELGETLNINTKSNDMFRMQYLKAGQIFSAYIALDSESISLEKDIIEILNSTEIRLGSDKSSGYGKCKIFNISIEDKPQFNKYSVTNDNINFVYMLLLSNMSMINEDGEICGIDEKLLSKKLGVNSLNIVSCSTSVVEVSGVNRTWGIRTPSTTMYQSGSVFKLKSKDNFNLENIKNIKEEGLGIKISEGCGRVVFIDNYEKICLKDPIKIVKNQKENYKIGELSSDEMYMLKTVAKALYLNRFEHKLTSFVTDEKNNFKYFKKSASDSQIGYMLTLCQNFSYTPDKVKGKFEDLFKHIESKKSIISEKHKGLIEFIRKYLDIDVTQTLELKSKLCGYNIEKDSDLCDANILTKDELVILKLKLIENVLKYYVRGKA